MHLFEISETVEKGLLLQREPYPHIVSPPSGDMRFVLAKNVSEAASRIPRAETRPLRMQYAELEIGKEMVELKRDPHAGRTRRKQSALVRVRVAGGVGGRACLLANCFKDTMLMEKRSEEVGRHYFPFPSEGVRPLCSESYAEQLRFGLEFVDVFLLLQPGAGFRVHRSGGLKDQYGEKASPQIAVRWIGHDLSEDRPGLILKHYYERVPMRDSLGALPAAAE